MIPGAVDHRERRILAESGVGFGQAAPIEGAAGCVGDGGGMAAGVAEADRVHRGAPFLRVKRRAPPGDLPEAMWPIMSV